MEADINVTMLYASISIGLGAISGFLDLDPILVLLIALFGFYMAYRLAPMVFDLENSSFDTSAWSMIKTGTIPYWFMLLVSWTLVYSFMIPY